MELSGTFDPAWYCLRYPDVAAAGGDPLDHFLAFGATEGRDPNPMFDTNWYLSVNPDVARASANPLIHYLEYGARENRRPSPSFDGRRYQALSGETGGANSPLARALRAMRSENRARPGDVPPSGVLAELYARSRPEFESLAQRLRAARMFDPDWYRARTPGLAATEDPLSHFLIKGEPALAVPYRTYLRSRAIASLRARSLPTAGSIYADFVDAQLALARTRIEQDRDAGSATWVLPSALTIETGDAPQARTFSLKLEPSDRPFRLWPIDGETRRALVIPFVAPGSSIRSVSIATEGASPGTVSIEVAESQAGPPLVRREAVVDANEQVLRCDLGDLPTLRHRRYFLRLDAERKNGFTLAATSFHPLPLVAKEIDRSPATRDDPKIEPPAAPSLIETARKLASGLGKTEAKPSTPHVAIVTILYRKTGSIRPFLDAIHGQSYLGPVTVVFVDDCSPDSARGEIERRIAACSAGAPKNIAPKLVRNFENLGNCLSRNAGIAACRADIYVVIDADCLINKNFLAAHVAEHALPGTDAVIGPYNIESAGQNAEEVLRGLEETPERAIELAEMQDEVEQNAYVNTVTRNFSIRREWLDANGLFDPAFTYSAKPDSGYGWEDVDVGLRIFGSGGRVRFTASAFSVHISHESSLSSDAQVRASAKNFERLAKKHPSVRTVFRRWYVDTADRIVGWAEGVNTSSPPIAALKADIARARAQIAPLLPYLRRQKPRLRILTHRWHVPHQAEIYKLPFEFTLATGTGTGFTDAWSFDQRPLPHNARLVDIGDIDPAEFDMAIVHFDENVLSPDLSNGILGTDWGDTFRWFTDNVRIPMVAVCHGTVPFVGQYGANPDAIDRFELYQDDAEQLRRRLGDVCVVVNSHEAAQEWQFKKSRVIWHGYDPQEFHSGAHELDIVTHGVDRARPHYRGAHALEAVLAKLGPDIKVSTHKHSASTPVPRDDPRFSDFAFANWLGHLGRHKIYLNTTLRSPMPRSRTEAMLCGVIPVSLDNHDVSRFIKNGINGFYATSADELADFCRSVCRNAAMFEKISAAARATAVDVFNHDRFLTQWVTLVEETIG